MKRILVFAMAMVLCLSLIACGGKDADNAAIVEYVEKNEDAILSSFESSFASAAGMTCSSSIKVEGMGFIITVKINELDNIDSATKKAMQDAYDSMDATFDESLEMMKTDLPELEYYQVIVCEKDGDKLATVTAGNK